MQNGKLSGGWTALGPEVCMPGGWPGASRSWPLLCSHAATNLQDLQNIFSSGCDACIVTLTFTTVGPFHCLPPVRVPPAHDNRQYQTTMSRFAGLK